MFKIFFLLSILNFSIQGPPGENVPVAPLPPLNNAQLPVPPPRNRWGGGGGPMPPPRNRWSSGSSEEQNPWQGPRQGGWGRNHWNQGPQGPPMGDGGWGGGPRWGGQRGQWGQQQQPPQNNILNQIGSIVSMFTGGRR